MFSQYKMLMLSLEVEIISNFVSITKIMEDYASLCHSNTLAWKIPWTEEPDRLQSMGSLRARHD